MFTIRHIEDNGCESIRETKWVASKPGDQVRGGERIIVCDNGQGGFDQFDAGIIYVMNDAGRTVAKYELGPPLTGLKAAQDLSEKFPNGVVR